MEIPVQLQSDEKLIKLLRRYPVSLVLNLIGIVVIVIIALVLWRVFAGGSSELLATIFLWVFIASVVVGLVAGFLAWYRYQNDLWLITTKRVIDYTKPTPFRVISSSASLLNLQDISIEKRGVLESMLNYGDVRCQTASASGGAFVFSDVANPQAVMDEIDEAREQARVHERVAVGPA